MYLTRTLGMAGHQLSLNGMLQKNLQNEVPATVLEQCAAQDQTLIENLLLLAQVELETLNLASTLITAKNGGTMIKCALTGTEARVGLACMRALQAYSPARIADVRAHMENGVLFLCIEVTDANTRISTTELEIVRVCKKKRFF